MISRNLESETKAFGEKVTLENSLISFDSTNTTPPIHGGSQTMKTRAPLEAKTPAFENDYCNGA